MQSAHDGPHRGLHDVGDLLVGEPFDIGEVNGEPEVLGNRVEGLLDVAVGQMVDRLRFGRARDASLRERLCGAQLPVLELVDGALVGGALVLPVRVDERVGEDAVQPRLQVRALLEARERRERLHERLLHEVAGIRGVPRHPKSGRIQLIHERNGLRFELGSQLGRRVVVSHRGRVYGRHIRGGFEKLHRRLRSARGRYSCQPMGFISYSGRDEQLSPVSDSAPGPWRAPLAAGPLDVTLTLPGSKSLTNRELVLAALADGPSLLRRPLHSRDSALMIEALRQLGVGIEEVAGDGEFGPDLRITPAELRGAVAIDCGLAGTVMRFVPPLAALGVRDGNMTIGDFVLINAFTMQIFMPLNFLGFVYREIRGSLANIDNLFSLLAQRPAISDKPDSLALTLKGGVENATVQFENVHFSYHDARPILNGITFQVEAGKKVAIVGESGAGKSTIMKLLFRFYEPTRGTVCVNGQDISQVTQNSLRSHIAIVPQDTVLFNTTLKDNIAYGNPNATDEEIMHAASLAHLNHFIAQLPDGINTKVGERGLKLSGGEKQRVAIARALLKGAPIMIFDEATSSLDSESEQAILAALRDAAKGHTSLVIAHRLSTIIDADNILVMNKGMITEQGTHSQLLQKQGVYAKLWHTQQSTRKR